MLEVEQVLQERYQLKEKLGQNAGRQTWLAEDLTTQPPERVILKLLTFGDQVQWESLRLFEREADVLKQLDHPQIPKYRDYFSIDDRILWFGLVHDYIPGSSLRELLSEGRKFSEQDIRNIATDVLSILVYLHELSPAVLHRDIKPSNLILGEDKRIYLVDFGAVQDRANGERATFTVIGTYGYAPMEQFGGRAVPASDLYALGATLIHLLTGTVPADLPQRKMRIQFSDRVSVSPHFVSWIDTLIEPDVEDRFSSARQALEALNNPYNPKTHLSIHKPFNSTIKLNKSLHKLEIKIPGRGIKALDIVGLIAGLAMSLVVSALIGSGGGSWLALLVWLVGSILSLGYLIPPLKEINLNFRRDFFLMDWSVLGKHYRQLRGKTSNIRNVYVYIYSQSNGENSSREMMKIVFITDEEKYTFGEFDFKKDEVECLWLVQEIKDWLGLRY
ncbi:MAG: serine/threonine-protein kinase [Scytonema sp. PMC 1069.18]|nr:serine/threonine-protein kinase [Scytonema sp. PMC 1069.18]MEC4882521.1 serine/threonine-protein kinase [Scytonema sp. PMC 1070.18]